MGLSEGHENFVGLGECPVEVAVMLLLHVGFEVVAGNDKVGVEEEVEWVVNRHPSSKNLWVVFVELSVDFVDICPKR